MSTLRVELVFDKEAGDRHYRVSALPINGGGSPTCEGAELDRLSPPRSPWKVTSRLRHRRRNPHPDLSVAPAA